jgi:radical SAM protein with 4Fe4S-binding SPASM domain
VKRNNLSGDSLISLARKLNEIGIFYVTITGGEPFLRPTELRQFIDALVERGIRIMINSNATLVTPEVAEWLTTYPIEIFLASIVSHNPKQHDKISNHIGAHAKTVTGIRNLQNQGIPVALNMVATQLNYKEVYATGKWAFETLGIHDFSATPICPSLPEHLPLALDRDEIVNVLNQLLSLRKELGTRVDILEVLPVCLLQEDDGNDLAGILSTRMCTAGNTTMTVGSEGQVRVCSYDNQSYGNILTENFEDIWNRMIPWRNNSLLPQDCKDCSILDTCGGGCRVSSKIRTGSYCSVEPLAKGTVHERRRNLVQIQSTIDPEARFRVTNDISFREENGEKFLAVANSRYFVILNAAGLSLLEELSRHPPFTLREIRDASSSPSSIDILFAELCTKGFLVLAS